MGVTKTNCILCNKGTEIEEDEPRICDDCFKCPKCGATPDNNIFIIDDGYCNRSQCETGWSIKDYEKVMLKKLKIKVCPHCKGKGTVPA